MKKIFSLVAILMVFGTLASRATLTLSRADGTPVADSASVWFHDLNPEFKAVGILQITGTLVLKSDADVRASIQLMAVEGDPMIDFCVNDQCIPADMIVNKNLNMVAGREYNLDFHLGGAPHLTSEILTAASYLTIKAGSQTLFNTIEMTNDPAGIDGVTADRQEAPSYFNLQGQPVAEPLRGSVVIRRQGEKASKIIY